MTTRKDGLTPARTDLPTVGMVIAVLDEQIRPHYYGPVTVVAVEPDRPRITLHCTGTTDPQYGDPVWSEDFEVWDGAPCPSDGIPYAILHWNLVTDLNESDRAKIEKVIAWKAEIEPAARKRQQERNALIEADQMSRPEHLRSMGAVR